MKQGLELEAKFPGVLIIHQKVKGRVKGLHLHDEHEVFLPLQGEITLKSADEVVSAGPGKMIYVPPGCKHSFHSSSSNQGERLILIMESSAWEKWGGGPHQIKVTPVSQLAKEILFHLLIYPKTKATQSLLETLVITLDEMLKGEAIIFSDELSQKVSDPRLERALKMIQDRYSRDLSMDELASSSGMSLRTLNRIFVEELSMTPKEVVTYFRMEEAKKLLKNKTMSVTDVALEVGYQSLSQFITTFRKKTGVLPSDYL